MLLQAERASYARTEYQGRAQARELVGNETGRNAFHSEGNRYTMGTPIVQTGGAEGSRVRDHADDDWEARRERYRGRDVRSPAVNDVREREETPSRTTTQPTPVQPFRPRPLRDDEVPAPWRRPIRPMIFRRLLHAPHEGWALQQTAFETNFDIPMDHTGIEEAGVDPHPDIEYFLSDRLPGVPDRHWDYIYPGQILPWQVEWLRRDRSISVANVVSAFWNRSVPDQAVSRSQHTFLTSGPTGPEIFEWFFRQRGRELHEQLRLVRGLQLALGPPTVPEDTNERHYADEYPNAFEQAAAAAEQQRQRRPRMRRPDLPRWLRNEISRTQYHREHQETLRESNLSEGDTEDDGERSEGET